MDNFKIVVVLEFCEQTASFTFDVNFNYVHITIYCFKVSIKLLVGVMFGKFRCYLIIRSVLFEN